MFEAGFRVAGGAALRPLLVGAAQASPRVTTLTRYGVIATLALLTFRSLREAPLPLPELRRRLPRCLGGLVAFGVGIACFFSGRLGAAPWDVLHGGLAAKLGLDVGLVINLVSLAVLPLWIPLRQRIGLGTVLNALVIGLVVDIVKPVLPGTDVAALQLAYVVAGLLTIAVGSGLYIGSGLGAGPRDGVMLGLRRIGLSVRVARTLIEVTTVLLGLLLGGRVGIGTVVFLVGIGPLVQPLLARLSLPPLVTPTSQ